MPRPVCACACGCLCGCMYVWMCGCVDACMYACVYVWVHACVDAFMYACIYVCMRMHVCVYVWMHVQTDWRLAADVRNLLFSGSGHPLETAAPRRDRLDLLCGLLTHLQEVREEGATE
eukprot:GHVU01038562.1.p2 GENE.GHVU01038562.1~~GHVU01038562.1.p2  ORF type:complete len:118 (-),score=14.27 GHVU01038562.1:96-449(-)